MLPGFGAFALPKGIVVLKSKVAYGLVAGLLMWVGLVSTAQALTLGDLRGSVLIGRALDVSVLVQAAPEESVSSACFKAEVFHAETLQPSASVTVTPLPGADRPGYRVRVQSRALVDEPVVTIALQSTCAPVLTRRYVLLADFPVVVMPVEPQAAPSPPLLAPVATPLAAPLTETPMPASAGSAASASSQAPSDPATATVVKPPVAAKPRVAAKQPRPPLAAKPASAPQTTAVAIVATEPGKPALKLEALNLSIGQSDGLGSTALSVPSPEALLQASQMQALQQELKQLKAQTARTNAQLAELQAQLQRAQSERVSLQLFYGVLGLLLLCVAALAWLLWQRYRGQQADAAGASILGELPQPPVELPGAALAGAVVPPAVVTETLTKPSDKPVKPAQSWWTPQSNTALNKVAVAPVVPVVPVAPVAPVADSIPVLPVTQEELNPGVTSTQVKDTDGGNSGQIDFEEIDLDIDLGSWDKPVEAASVATAPAEPVTEQSFTLEGEPLAESLPDIRQQDQLSVLQGQTESAIQVLKKQIAESSQPDALLYLNLFSLFHSLGCKADFREYRTEFNRHFNCELPDFPAYHLEGLDLLAYPDQLTHLTQVWNKKEVISYLNACILRGELVLEQPTFELAALRDLLLLRSIAQQVLEPELV